MGGIPRTSTVLAAGCLRSLRSQPTKNLWVPRVPRFWGPGIPPTSTFRAQLATMAGCPMRRLCFLSHGWESTNLNRLGRWVPQVSAISAHQKPVGAPGPSLLGTRDTTNLNLPRSTCHNGWVGQHEPLLPRSSVWISYGVAPCPAPAQSPPFAPIPSSGYCSLARPDQPAAAIVLRLGHLRLGKRWSPDASRCSDLQLGESARTVARGHGKERRQCSFSPLQTHQAPTKDVASEQ